MGVCVCVVKAVAVAHPGGGGGSSAAAALLSRRAGDWVLGDEDEADYWRRATRVCPLWRAGSLELGLGGH